VRVRPELNWPYMIFLAVTAFLGLGFIAYMAAFSPFRGSPAEVIWTRIALYAFCLFAFVALVVKIRNDSQFEFDDDGVSKPTLFGIKTLHWNEVLEVRLAWPAVHLVGSDTRITIFPYVYADPYAFMPEIGKRLQHLLSDLPEQSGKAGEQLSGQPSSISQTSSSRTSFAEVLRPRNLAMSGHIASICLYVLVFKGYQSWLAGFWGIGAIGLWAAVLHASDLLWKRASARTAVLVEVTWVAIVASAVLTSPASWSERERMFIAFLVAFVALQLLHLLSAWARMSLARE
jgi:hypothetical protein